ncbi:MAG TPA: hypothetical protein VGJ04_08440 [Pirellulales bacterium]
MLRLSFGLAAAMGLTSPRRVTSGYFRNHAYVLLGLSVLATLAAVADRSQLLLWPPLAAGIFSYLCAAVWLYEKPYFGKALLWAVAAASLLGALPTRLTTSSSFDQSAIILWDFDPVTSGLLLGSTIAAMFLGHWYLNTPTMELAPLRRLLLLMVVAVLARAIVCAVGLILQADRAGLSSTQWLLVGLRWLAGIFGTAVLIAMSWQTLKIPNTQSATGILYVAVITTFLGELTSLLLSAGTSYPL